MTNLQMIPNIYLCIHLRIIKFFACLKDEHYLKSKWLAYVDRTSPDPSHGIFLSVYKQLFN